MTKNPAEIAGTRYKDEKLMSRVQKTDGTSRCFAQIVNIKRQSLINAATTKSSATNIVNPKEMIGKYKKSHAQPDRNIINDDMFNIRHMRNIIESIKVKSVFLSFFLIAKSCVINPTYHYP